TMEDNKKRVADSAGKSGFPKKQRVAKKSPSTKGKKKDHNKPKRPMTAYFFFLASARENLRKRRNAGEEDVPTKIGDIAKYAGNEWKQMTTEEKQPFTYLHEEAKKEYENKLKKMQPIRDE
ncbi:hypothetical protein, partial [Salmonella sp. s54925]|uniref:hypothetical protein n=1 Tax=Salmonella sp. s54925 TaxID=3159674 RepID=UPI00397FEE99